MSKVNSQERCEYCYGDGYVIVDEAMIDCVHCDGKGYTEQENGVA